MIIDFNSMEEQILPRFKDGEIAEGWKYQVGGVVPVAEPHV